MDYQESLSYLESLYPSKLPCLERMSAFMAEIGDLQNAFPAVHVAGTNGKGSVVAMLDSMLRAHGLTVGRYTGPHILRWNERFHLNGRPIDDQTFAAYATELRLLSEKFARRHEQYGPLTWFEFLTALAFLYFARQRVDVAVLEVGLGGRWDATNVVHSPSVCALTNVDLDHTHILGETVEEIAREKAGIIKDGVPVVTGCQAGALRVVQDLARSKNAPLITCSAPGVVHSSSLTIAEEEQLQEMLNLLAHCQLKGNHQRHNATIAISCLLMALRQIPVPLRVEAARKGLSSTYWPGRMQYLREHNLVLDGAHNPAGAKVLRAALEDLFPGRKFVFVLSFFENKRAEEMLCALISSSDAVFAAKATGRRPGFSAADIVQLAGAMSGRASAFQSVAAALHDAMDQRSADEVIVCTGSFATVREAMQYLGWQCVEDGQAAVDGAGGQPTVMTGMISKQSVLKNLVAK